ncbi:MAG: hypothetical protein QGH51_00795 [Planctomycetota bacterium]|nr:hypothetical protein [Planctomycetota bacterium]
MHPCSIRLFGALPLLVLGACSTSPEDIERLEDFQQRATRYYQANDLDRAEQQARMGLAIEEDHAILNLILGRTYLKRHDLRSVAASKEYLEKAYSEKVEFRTSYSLGEYHLRYSEFLLGQADLLEDRASQLPETEAKAAAEMESRSKTQRAKANEHLLQCQNLLEEALAESPKSIYALRLMANCASHLGLEDEALLSIQVLVEELDRSRKWKNTRLASDGSLDLAQERHIRDSLKEEIKIEVEARGLAAALHKNAGRFQDTIHELTQILNLAPNMEHEYFNRGMCHYWLGHLNLAAKDMKQFLRRTSLKMDAEEVSQALDIVAESEGKLR